MSHVLETTVDKFTFKVPTDRLYSTEGLWILWPEPADAARVRVGLTDYLQQSSGDMAFVEIRPVGTRLQAGEEIGSVETIKVNVGLALPFEATIVGVNPSVKTSPELINRDPYGEGWVVELELMEGAAVASQLVQPDAYLALMRAQAEQEVQGK
jgi:glycine cleavage system H protein